MAQNGTDWKPKPLQVKIVQLMVDIDDKRSLKAKLESINVPRRTFYNWMEDQRFREYLQSQVDLITEAKLPDAWKSLMRNIDRGETQAIKLFFELKGKYTPKVEMSGKDGGPMTIRFVSGADGD